MLRVAGDPTAIITGAQESQVQLQRGLGCTKRKSDLTADSRPILSLAATVSSPRVGPRPVENCNGLSPSTPCRSPGAHGVTQKNALERALAEAESRIVETLPGQAQDAYYDRQLSASRRTAPEDTQA
jgi:hypothetical protein